MSKITIKLLNSYGDELDRQDAAPDADTSQDEAVQAAIVQLTLRCIVTPGDSIAIIEKD